MFWLNYRRGISDSHAHVCYMEERLGSLGVDLRHFRNNRISLREGGADEQIKKAIHDYEQSVLRSDKALEFVTAARTCFMFFDGNTSFRWTFVSPPALYRPGKRTGNYQTILDEIPLKPSNADGDVTDLENRLHGITAADLAIAIADEAETQKFIGKHWSAFADMSDDTPTPSYVTLA
ncbi:uncharacterized protein JN550_004670 [Neoarthrinium moseri]|uniref:uncharacterized protein n=1 Tax=Neoarthrinium moseri TaxID=1658444 RepID=UPI001FDE4AD9|nr:uncharacterized protein JN550_004670 [Neoarthrinium moseri]KAI1871225.1 hypothetical protein JN550_004670 [Neoarthrinium moseri]